MGRGRMVSGGGGSRGSMVSSGGSRGGISNGGPRRGGGGHHRTTIIVGGGHHYHHSGSPVVGIIVGTIFVLVGICMIFGGFGKVIESFKYSTVEATCLGNEFIDGGYYSTYEYVVNGINYENSSNQSWTKKETVDKVVTIYYLESDPNEIYEEKPASVGEGVIIIFAGLIFAGLGSLPLVFAIKELKKKKAGDTNVGDYSTEPVVQEETHTRCPYCGSKYNKTSESCPKCGASRID